MFNKLLTSLILVHLLLPFQWVLADTGPRSQLPNR
jgi:hypothetical protein